MLQVQQRLGDFEIIRLLGKGGMGEVYEARQSNPDRLVALKVLSPWLAENDDALERFWREAEVPAKLDHPNIVRIISTGKTAGVAYYAMQLVRGISLSDMLRQARDTPLATQQQPTTDPAKEDQTTREYRPTPTPAAKSDGSLPGVLREYQSDRFGTTVRIGIQAARALASAHGQGYLHRDIKPSNLMIDLHNQLYLVDFGLTRALTAASDITRNGVLVGTPWYMSPEQARGEPLDARSDLFSLGVTLYQLATGGRGPYTASHVDSDAVLMQVRQGELLPLDQVAPDCPVGLQRIVMKAVDTRPERRYQSMEEMVRDLEGRTASSPELARTLLFNPRPRAAKRTAAYIAAALLIAGLVGAALLNSNRNSTPDSSPPRVQGLAELPPVVAPQIPPPKPDPWKMERVIGARQPLLRVDNQPIESKKLKGSGAVSALSTALTLTSAAEPLMPTFIALAGMPKQGYEFRAEMKQASYASPKTNDLGLFFGWQESSADPLARQRFFVVQLDNRPVLNDTHGRLNIGTALLEEGPGAMFDFFRPIHQGRSWIPLADSGSEESQWHTVIVRVQHPRITVTVDKQPQQEFDVPWMLNVDRNLQAFALDPRGMLGLWVRNGHGYFRNVTLMALAGE